ncbi:cupin domain-containing protein [Streptomyces sudanensis]|uniref:cupin domain-containing protein n=1 Tax=Streptomyces sudanensis TaxID=436397 RepID=UPI0020CBD067|nr:cupin domain-containing protein [Streptomyces sudanensis]MCP9999687.1 cupin domain-containing protein [Streptomyces sudanensis]
MITRAFDRSAMSWSYEMHLQPMLSAADIKGLPFGSVFGSVPAHSVSKRHAHQDGEMFIVLSGRAVVVLGEEERELGPGGVVYLSPFGFHEIRNESDEPFDIVSVYWEDIPSAVEAWRRSRRAVSSRSGPWSSARRPPRTAACTSGTSPARTSAPTCWCGGCAAWARRPAT